mmetsp:Transcript_65176/g.173780  ORF Transcript_65176/g.173780 Transcript_65176/m.173780 type:complete len:527 (-) Transcript_65176:281-1861(-)
MVARKHLGSDLHLCILGNHVWWNLYSLHNLDARRHDRVMLHVAHGDEPVDLCDAQPVQDIGHEDLEAGVGHASHLLGAVEILGRLVTALLALTHVVDEVFCHLPKRSALFSEVYNDSCAASLSTLDALLDGLRQVRPACADVRAKHIAPVALVVHPARKLDGLVRDLLGVSPDVDRHPADGRQEQLHVHPRQQLRVHGVGLLEDGLAQRVLRNTEALCNAGEVPNWLNGRLCHKALPVLGQDGTVRLQPPGLERLPALRQLNVRLRHGDRGANVEALLEPGGEALRDDVPPGVDGHDALGVMPSGEGADAGHRRGHAQPRHVAVLDGAADPRQRSVDGVSAGVGPDGVALHGVPACGKHGAAKLRRGRAPLHDHWLRPKRAVVRGQRCDALVLLHHLGDIAGGAVLSVLAEDQGDRLVVQVPTTRIVRGARRSALRRHRQRPRATVLSVDRAVDALGHRVACGRPELPVASVAEARQDVAVRAQRLVHSNAVDAHVRVVLLQLRHALVGRNNAEHDDLRRAPTFQL